MGTLLTDVPKPKGRTSVRPFLVKQVIVYEGNYL